MHIRSCWKATFNMGNSFFCVYFQPSQITFQIAIEKARMLCLGFETRAALIHSAMAASIYTAILSQFIAIIWNHNDQLPFLIFVPKQKWYYQQKELDPTWSSLDRFTSTFFSRMQASKHQVNLWQGSTEVISLLV